MLKRLDWLDIPTERLRNAYFRAPYMPREMIKHIMQLQSFFAQYLCESVRKFRELSARLENENIRRAREYIEKNFRNGQMQLGDVSRQAGLSRIYFCGVFRKETGVHYSRYLQNIRVTEAKHLLSATEKSISEICHDCGFNSLTHFNRVFRRSESLSPRQYREQIRKDLKK